jgi:hypothetical protein
MLRHPLVTLHVVRFVQTPPRRPLQPPQPPALAARSRRPVSATGSQTAPRGARTGRAGPGDVPLTATRPDPPRAISSQSRKAGLAAIAEGQVQTGTTLPPLLIPLEPPETFPRNARRLSVQPATARVRFRANAGVHGIYIIARNFRRNRHCQRRRQARFVVPEIHPAGFRSRHGVHRRDHRRRVEKCAALLTHISFCSNSDSQYSSISH